MPDAPFITRELDRRIAVAQQAIRQGRVNAIEANRALMPWAAAEAWIVGGPGHGTSPRDRQSRADQLCPLADTIAELTRARDSLVAKLEREASPDLGARFLGLTDALRDLNRLQALRQAFAAQRTAPAASPSFPTSAPSLLADMFGPNGKPLPIERRVA
jgi:hypothetical protein